VPDRAVVDLSAPRSIHLVGIGGAGISAIGLILATMGHRVSGSDVTETAVWPRLAEAGVTVEVVQASELFSAAARQGADLVGHSTAFPPAAADLDAAAAAGITVLDRAGILAAICAVRPTVAVSGTHGKTSTTAMLATLLSEVGADPSYLIGATALGLGRAARWGGPEGAFVVEADESDGSFLELGATMAVVTNVDEDHLDHWGSMDAIDAAFDRFLAAAPQRVICIDAPGRPGEVDPRADRLARAHGASTVGEAATADYRLHDVTVSHLRTTFGLRHDGVEIGPVVLGTPGRHHALNATLALAAAVELGVDVDEGVRALGAYVGVSRRFEVLGVAGGVTVVDDYAHNAGKVRALVASAKQAGWDRVVVVFQPHRFTRTRDQGLELGAALALADLAAVTEVYGAGEEPIEGADGLSVLHALLDSRPRAEVAWTPTLSDVRTWARDRLRPGDLCLTVGAGDVHGLGPLLLADLDASKGTGAR